MDVIGFDPFISVNTAWNLSRNVQRAMSLEELFAASDYITVHVPLTDDTKGVFNKETFSIMKPDVHILNFSRGELVNEEDMKAALESGKVGRYITDFPNQNVLNMKKCCANSSFRGINSRIRRKLCGNGSTSSEKFLRNRKR